MLIWTALTLFVVGLAIALVDRRQLAYLHLRHITESRLDVAIRLVINGYNRFRLPKYWGSGKRVAAAECDRE